MRMPPLVLTAIITASNERVTYLFTSSILSHFIPDSLNEAGTLSFLGTTYLQDLAHKEPSKNICLI